MKTLWCLGLILGLPCATQASEDFQKQNPNTVTGASTALTPQEAVALAEKCALDHGIKPIAYWLAAPKIVGYVGKTMCVFRFRPKDPDPQKERSFVVSVDDKSKAVHFRGLED